MFCFLGEIGRGVIAPNSAWLLGRPLIGSQRHGNESVAAKIRSGAAPYPATPGAEVFGARKNFLGEIF